MTVCLMVIYIAYLVGLGQVWYRFLARPWRWQWTHLAWSFGLGTILWSYALLLLNLLNLPTRGGFLYMWQMILLVLPVTGDALVKLPLQTVVSPPPNPPIRWAKLLALLLMGVAALTAALQALAYPMHMWDSIVIYGFNAKILFQEQTVKTDAFMDPSVLHFSADYPLLLSYLEAGFYRWLGHPDDRVVRLLFLAFWGSWLGILYEALAARISKNLAWILLAVIATLPLFSNLFMGQTVSGFADIPFAFYWTGFLICGLQIMRGDFKAVGGVMALFALGCAFIKNEGLVAIIVGWVLFILADPEAHKRSWISSVSGGFLLLLPWWWLRSLLPHNSLHYARVLNLPAAQFVERLNLIGSSFAQEITQIHSWGLFWLLVLLGLLWPKRQLPISKDSKILLFAVAAQLCAYGYVYLIYPHNLGLLIPTTLQRLLIHTIGPLTLALGWRLEE